jgi:membrane protein
MFGVTLALVGWLLAIALIVVAATVVAAEFDRAPDPWAERLRRRLRLARVAEAGRPGAAPPSPDQEQSRPGTTPASRAGS